MLAYLRENIQTYALFLIWMIVGMYGGPVIFAVLPITLLLLRKKELFETLLLGFFFILVLSDSLQESLEFAKSVKNIYIILLAFFFFVNIDSFTPLRNTVFKIFIPFFLIASVCLFFSETYAISIQKTLSYILLYLLVPSYVLKAYRQNGPVFLKNLVFFMVSLIAIGILMIFINRDVAFLLNERFRGILGSPNGLGIVSFLVFVVFRIVDSIGSVSFSRNEKIFIYTTIILSIVLSESRNAVFVLILFIIYARFYKISPLLGFIIFLISILLYELLNTYMEEILAALGLSKYFRVETLAEGSGRYIAWKFAWDQIQKNFFIGKGIGYDEFYMRSNYNILTRLGHQGGIHNSFLTFWMNTGLIGLIIYLRSYILLFFKAAKNSKLAFPALFSISFTAMFESWLVGSLNPFNIIFVIAVTLMIEDEFHENAEIKEVAIEEDKSLIV